MTDRSSPPVFAVAAVRDQFAILQQQIQGFPLVYFDNAATTQKPECVLAAMNQYYRTANANVHRSAHTLANMATGLYEDARQTVADFIHAAQTLEIIWTRGTTEAINLVAYGWGLPQLQPGDEILVSAMEHHANFVPWQQIALKTGAIFRVIPLLSDGTLDLAAYQSMLSERTRLVAVTHMSNVLGIENPVRLMIQLAHAVGALILVDGAQAVAHQTVDVQALDCDFYVFSAHKMFGPTGIGVLYGKTSCLEILQPWQYGGEMIYSVTDFATEFNTLPWRLEAGTPPIAEAVGCAAAVRFVIAQRNAGADAYLSELRIYLLDQLRSCPGIQLLAEPSPSSTLVSISPLSAHPHDVCELLDAQGIAIRAGHHCAMPLLQRLGYNGAIRISLALYNTREEVDRFISALHSTLELLHE